MTERRELPHNPRDVRKALQLRISDLLPRLGVNDMPANGMVAPLNPRRADRHPGSFVIWTEGDAIGAWRDYALSDEHRGDVFDLIQYLGRLDRWIDAYWWALDFLGLGRGEVRSASQARLDAERAKADQLAGEKRAAANVERQARSALGLWLTGKPLAAGDLAWEYLTGARGLPLEQLSRAPGALRFHPALEHIDRDTGEVTAWPALLSAMSHWDGGQVRAVHRTYLAKDGKAKAPVAAAKKMMGAAAEAAVRVWKGAGDLSPEEARRQGVTAPLIITEGIEDALTAAIAQPTYRIWAAGSLSLMGRLGWPACASAVVLVADNDWDKPQAIEAFAKVEARWREMAHGRPLKVVRAEAGKDLNDWARGVG